MTDGQTFADHLPLMNYWAGFTASKEVSPTWSVEVIGR